MWNASISLGRKTRPVTPTMPQLRAPQMTRSNATGSIRFTISTCLYLLGPYSLDRANHHNPSTLKTPPGYERRRCFLPAPGGARRRLPVPGCGCETLGVEVALQLVYLVGVHRIDVVGIGEPAGPDLARVGAHTLNHLIVDRRVALDEPRIVRAGCDAEQIVEHEHLAVG